VHVDRIVPGDPKTQAGLIEAWGAPYHRAQPGLHQIHSRRASSAVPEDLRGRDGAVRFYFDEDQRSELALLKFSGQ
jgi:hypothetical protein